VATAALRVGYPVASVQRSRATKPLPKEGLRPRGAATFGTPQVSRAVAELETRLLYASENCLAVQKISLTGRSQRHLPRSPVQQART